MSPLGGLDLVAVALRLCPEPAARVEHSHGLPVEVRCVDRATAAIIEALARARPEGAWRITRLGLHALVDRAERHRYVGQCDVEGRRE